MGRLSLAGTLGAAGLAVLHVCNLLGSAYSGYAERRLDTAREASAMAAADVAVKLTPWSSRRAALRAWLLAEHGSSAAYAAYEDALRLAPAEPLLWIEFAQAMARLGRFDPVLQSAVGQAGRLAPHSPAVRSASAAMGLSYWPRGSAALRELWLQAMRAELAQNRSAFLASAIARGQAVAFCADPGPQLGERDWCETVPRLWQEGCFDTGASEPAPCPPTL